MAANPGAIQTGNEVVDNILTVLLSTSMFVAGVLGFTLDNTIPGTPEERGLVAWKKQHEAFQDDGSVSKIYDIPFITPYLERSVLTHYRYVRSLVEIYTLTIFLPTGPHGPSIFHPYPPTGA